MSSPSSSSLNLSSHPVVLAASALAQAHHAHYDPSHDYHHVTRVKRLAVSIAKDLNSSSTSSSSSSPSEAPVDLLVVTLAALTHDLLDAKYLPPGAPSDARSLLEEKLWASFPGEDKISTEQRRLVERVIENVSYSKEKKRRAAGEETEWHRTCLELHCVQDADKLDAIGAFGSSSSSSPSSKFSFLSLPFSLLPYALVPV